MAVMKRMKAFATFDEYQADQTPRNQAIIRELRKLVRRVTPGLLETVKWGNGCWVRGKENVAYAYSATGYEQFGFFGGSEGPEGAARGHGKVRPAHQGPRPCRHRRTRLRETSQRGRRLTLGPVPFQPIQPTAFPFHRCFVLTGGSK